MRHLIQWVDRWEPAVMVWDDEAGTLGWTAQPAEPHPSRFTPELMEELVQAVDGARVEGRMVLHTPPEKIRFVLEDPAHDPADFLRLIDEECGCIRCEDVRLPASLKDVAMTPPEKIFELPLGTVA